MHRGPHIATPCVDSRHALQPRVCLDRAIPAAYYFESTAKSVAGECCCCDTLLANVASDCLFDARAAVVGVGVVVMTVVGFLLVLVTAEIVPIVRFGVEK